MVDDLVVFCFANFPDLFTFLQFSASCVPVGRSGLRLVAVGGGWPRFVAVGGGWPQLAAVACG